MPKNVLFSLKNHQMLHGGSALRPPYLWRLRLRPRPLHQSSCIVNSSLCICPHAQTLSELTKRPCNYSRSAPGFRRRKYYVAFRILQTTEITTIGFNFFVFSPPPLILRWRRPCPPSLCCTWSRSSPRWRPNFACRVSFIW